MVDEWDEDDDRSWLPEGTQEVVNVGGRIFAAHYYHGKDARGHGYTASERGGLVVFTLMSNRGQRFTTGYIARLIGVQRSGAYKLLCKLVRVTPIRQETVYVSNDGKLRDVWVID